MADELRIKIGADVVEFTKSIAEVETELKGLQASVKNLGGQELVKVNKQIGELTETLQRVKNVGKAGFDEFGVALKNTGTAAGQTGTTLTNLSRIASDAPFGFIAIQNNLEPLIQSFGSLSKQSGGTGAALKALAGSLAGPAGLAVGFSVVSALVTTAIQKYGSLGNAISSIFSTNEQFILQQKQLAEIRTEAATSAGKEIANLDLLSAVSKDVTNSLSNRKDAADKLLTSYKEYLPKLTQEAILNGQAADAINAAKDAILQKALAAASEKKLAEITAKQLDNQLKQLDAVNEYGTAQKNFAEASSKYYGKELSNAQGVNYELQIYRTELDKAKSNLQGIGQEAQTLQKEYDKLIQVSSGFAKAAGGAFITGDEAKKEQERIKLSKERAKQSQNALSEQNKLFNEALAKEIMLTEELAKQEKKAQQIGEAYVKSFGKKSFFVEGSKLNVEIPPIDTTKATEALNRAKASIDAAFGRAVGQINLEKLAQQAQVAATLFSQVFNPIVDQFFTNIEEGQSVFKGLGDVVKNFVKNAIVQLIKLAAYSAILSLFTGGQGGTFASRFGSSFKGGLGGAFGLPKMGSVAGGGVNVNVAGQFALRGTDLVASVASSQQSIKRVG